MRQTLIIFVILLMTFFSLKAQVKPPLDRLRGPLKMGMEYFRNGEIDKAEKEFLKAIQINKRSFIAHEMLAQIYFQKKQYPEAIKNAETAIKLNPKTSRAYLVIGGVLHEKGEIEKSREMLKKALDNASSQDDQNRIKLFIKNFQERRENVSVENQTTGTTTKPTITIDRNEQSEMKPSVAVFPFRETNVRTENTKIGDTISEMITTELIQTNRFYVMERAQLQKVLEEQSLSQSGVVDSETAVEVGKLVGLEVVVIGSISQLKSVIEGDARLIEVKTGKAITAASSRVNNIDNVRNLATELASQLANQAHLIPKTTTSNKIDSTDSNIH